MGDCVHHWLIPDPIDGIAVGRCKNCGEEAFAIRYDPEYAFNNKTPAGVPLPIFGKREYDLAENAA